MTWRYFRQFELREALAHVEAGGVAVHETGRPYMGKTAAHLLAGTRRQLMTAAEVVGVDAKYLQLEPTPHFDLFGLPLMLALRKCLADEEDICSACAEKK